jgi:hypothetical protein
MSTIVDIVVAGIALAALVVSILANRNAKRAAVAAERSAFAALRQAAAAEAALPPAPPAVDWLIEARGKHSYAVRNIGTETAEGVQLVVPDSHDGLVRPELGDGSVPPGTAFRVVVFTVDQLPDLTELQLIWSGHDDPMQLPLPPTPTFPGHGRSLRRR